MGGTSDVERALKRPGQRPAAGGDGDGDLAGVPGMAMPALRLESTGGSVALTELAADLLVLFVYPHATGLPGAPVAGWDLIPGARGCTAQSCAFRDEHARLSALGATVAGLSVQTVDEQRAFAARVGLAYSLISDPERRLAAALGLPTFGAGGRAFYERLTLIAAQGRVCKVFHPVREPERNAAEVADWLEREYELACCRSSCRREAGRSLPCCCSASSLRRRRSHGSQPTPPSSPGLVMFSDARACGAWRTR